MRTRYQIFLDNDNGQFSLHQVPGDIVGLLVYWLKDLERAGYLFRRRPKLKPGNMEICD